MAVWTYLALEKVILGQAAAPTVRAEAERLGASRIFIVTSASVARSSFLESLKAGLEDRLAGVFPGVRAHIPLDDVLAAAAAARAARADLILAVGGGSAIDAAKVVLICLRHEVADVKGLARFKGFGDAPDPSRRPADEARWVRMIAVPTTLSAAEFTWWGGALDTTTMTKEPYAAPLCIPRTIVLDPEATLSAPVELLLATGMKAIDHAAERLTSSRQDALSDARCIHCLKLLAPALRAIKADPAALPPRLAAQTAMAIGMAAPLTGVGVGASHAVGHALGAHAGVQHGLTSCAMLPATMRWNAAVNGARQAIVSEALGHPGAAAGDVIETLIVDLGLPCRLRDLGVARGDFPLIAAKVMGDHSIGANARKPKGPEDVVELLQLAW
jgi:maleylacetate reductase